MCLMQFCEKRTKVKPQLSFPLGPKFELKRTKVTRKYNRQNICKTRVVLLRREIHGNRGISLNKISGLIPFYIVREYRVTNNRTLSCKIFKYLSFAIEEFDDKIKVKSG